MTGVSATIITYNEESNIGRCLESLDWVDEIVVVDSGSQDRTRDIAAEYTDRVVGHPWEGHIGQKAFAVRQASNDWILAVDADEEVSAELRMEIEGISNQCRFGGYRFPRRTRYLGRWIRFGDWNPDRRVRLFDRRKAHWGGANPHDRVIVQADVGRLEAPLLHYPYPDLSAHLRKINFLTTVAAAQRYEAGQRATLNQIAFHTLGKFLRCYFLRLGMLDGFRGFVIAWLGSFSTFLKYVKLRELNRLRQSPTPIEQIRPVRWAAGGASR